MENVIFLYKNLNQLYLTVVGRKNRRRWSKRNLVYVSVDVLNIIWSSVVAAYAAYYIRPYLIL